MDSLGAAFALFALAFIGGLGAVMGAVAGLKLATWAFGPIGINVTCGAVTVHVVGSPLLSHTTP